MQFYFSMCRTNKKGRAIVPSPEEMLHEITRITTFVETIGEVSLFDQVMIKLSLQAMAQKIKTELESHKRQFHLIQGGGVHVKAKKPKISLLSINK